MNNQDLFVDGILNVTLVKGVIRLDLYSLSATNYNKDGHPQPEFRRRLVMNPQTLIAFQQDIQGAITALRERGLMPLPPQSGSGGPQMSVYPAAQNGPAVEPPAAAPSPSPSARPETEPAPEAPPPSLAAPTAPETPPASETEPRPRSPRSRNFPSTMGS